MVSSIEQSMMQHTINYCHQNSINCTWRKRVCLALTPICWNASNILEINYPLLMEWWSLAFYLSSSPFPGFIVSLRAYSTFANEFSSENNLRWVHYLLFWWCQFWYINFATVIKFVYHKKNANFCIRGSMLIPLQVLIRDHVLFIGHLVLVLKNR